MKGYLSILCRSFSDHHLRCGWWLNLQFSNGKNDWDGPLKLFTKKQIRGMLKTYSLNESLKLLRVLDETTEEGGL